MSPSFLLRIIVISKQQVTQWIEDRITGTDVFLVDLRISTSNQIRVILDADNGLAISQCVQVSRAIESQLDRDQEDFELQVTSFGVGNPLKLVRQYKNNIGRKLQVNLKEGDKLEGKLIDASDEAIQLTHRVQKVEAGKKKTKPVEETTSIGYEQIEEAKVIVSF